MENKAKLETAKWIASAGGLGFIPIVPATWTSLVVCFGAWFISTEVMLGLTVVFSIAGIWASGPSRIVFKSDDPKPFVMDEVCGMLLTLLWLPKEPVVYIAAFFLFRLLYVWKPGPIMRLQRSRHPASIMWDDMAAGVLGNLILHIAVRVWM